MPSFCSASVPATKASEKAKLFEAEARRVVSGFIFLFIKDVSFHVMVSPPLTAPAQISLAMLSSPDYRAICCWQFPNFEFVKWVGGGCDKNVHILFLGG